MRTCRCSHTLKAGTVQNLTHVKHARNLYAIPTVTVVRMHGKGSATSREPMAASTIGLTCRNLLKKVYTSLYKTTFVCMRNQRARRSSLNKQPHVCTKHELQNGAATIAMCQAQLHAHAVMPTVVLDKSTNCPHHGMGTQHFELKSALNLSRCMITAVKASSMCAELHLVPLLRKQLLT